MSEKRRFQTRARHEGNAMATLRSQAQTAWPNQCPDCGGDMEFDFSHGRTARRCVAPRCGRVITTASLRPAA